MQFSDLTTLAPGHALARGVWRHLAGLNAVAVPEFTPARGLRCDLTALTSDGEIWIVECKSSLADFRADSKWHHYLEYCDRFFWAVDESFPQDILPADAGLIIADAHDAAILRAAPLDKLPAARRKAQTLKLARAAARRLHAALDPGALA
ncbi:MAG: MmcB family DNA repair protein [Pseudomonadota bacterium]